jgi:hypothetical protein
LHQADAFGDIGLKVSLENQLADEIRHKEELERFLAGWDERYRGEERQTRSGCPRHDQGCRTRQGSPPTVESNTDDLHAESATVGAQRTLNFNHQFKKGNPMSTKKHLHENDTSHTVKSDKTDDKLAQDTHVPSGERSQRIQLRAYAMWEQAGKPDGDADRERFWCEAEKEFPMSASRNT